MVEEDSDLHEGGVVKLGKDDVEAAVARYAVPEFENEGVKVAHSAPVGLGRSLVAQTRKSQEEMR